jgi:hypothetical protein
MPQRPNYQRRRPGGRGYRERQTNTREVRQRFLIVCEGTETEPKYFDGFRMPIVSVRTVGMAQSPIQIIDAAIRLRDEAERDSNRYDQTWGMFDRDTWTINDFNNAFHKARANGIKVAYSNEAFELWFLLHFEYCNTATPRAEFARRISNYLPAEYAKNSRTMYDQLRPRVETAVRNAERLLEQYDPPNPATDNPSTTVHLLVKELLRFTR